MPAPETAGNAALSVRELDRVDALEALADDWRGLLAAVHDDSPYLTPEFMIPWARMLAERYRLCVLAVREGTRLVGLALFFERRLAKWGVGFTVRSFPLHGFSPPFDLVVDPATPHVIDALLDHLRRDRRWHLVELLNVPSTSPNPALLRAACARQGLAFSSQPSLTTTHVRMAESWDAYQKTLPRALRKTVRQGLRRLEQSGPVRVLRCPIDGIPVQDGVELALAVIASSWKRFDDEQVDWPAFLHELAASLAAHNMLSLRFLMVGDRPAAYHLELDYRGNLHGLHNAYDLRLAAGAPGAVLLSEALRDAHARGCARFDFLGTKQYLERWAQEQRDYLRLRITGTHPVTRLKTLIYDRVAQARKARAQQDEEAQRLARLGRAQGESTGEDSPAAP